MKILLFFVTIANMFSIAANPITTVIFVQLLFVTNAIKPTNDKILKKFNSDAIGKSFCLYLIRSKI